jgi:hypothetical protein
MSGSAEEAAQSVVKRPSIALAEINAYLLALQTIETSIQLNLDDLIREILLENIDMAKATKAAQSAGNALASAQAAKKPGAASGRQAAPTAPAPVADNVPLMFAYTQWYADTVVTKIMGNAAVYSNLRRSFVSRGNLPLRLEKYADLSGACLPTLSGTGRACAPSRPRLKPGPVASPSPAPPPPRPQS